MKQNMEEAENLKQLVKDKYSEVAEQSRETNASSCCGASACCTADAAVMADDYTQLNGYVPEADLGLGCGLPTEFAKISEGDTVIDLGSGAGNDCFVARSLAGENGRVIGIDFTDKMIEKARANAEKLAYRNVEFIYGDIEKLPLADEIADVVVSNCVLNLVPDKGKAFGETFRVLKNGGHFSVSDIVLEGDLPNDLKKVAELYAGCISGAIQKEHYLDVVKRAGFVNVTLQKEKEIVLPDEILLQYMPGQEIAQFRSRSKILSITLYGEKPSQKKTCCSPECCS